MKPRVFSAGKTAIADLSPAVRRYADKPYGLNAKIAWDYHLRAYECWCADRHLKPFPLDIDQLLLFGTDRAKTYAFYNVREDVRLVAMHHRKTTGEDLFCDTRVAAFLSGVRRLRPPQPVRPLRPDLFLQIVECDGSTWKTRRSRVMAMLIWSAGFTIRELHQLDVEMITLSDRGAQIKFPTSADYRETVFIGQARETRSCPVIALERLLTERQLLKGPVFNRTPKGRPDIVIRLSMQGVSGAIRLLGKQAGIKSPLSVERSRLGGIITQSLNVDIVTLAHFHGLRAIDHLAAFLGRKTERSHKFLHKQRYTSRSS